MTDRRDEALAVLRDNRRDGYTVPSATLYPFQWNWDAAFVAFGLAAADPAAARRELRTLLGATHEDGLLPHIVFHRDADGYFPGAGEWGVDTDPPTSAITQPPMVAPAARRVYERTGDDAFRDAVRPALDRHLSWWVRERGTDGVVAVRHPWETGMDDSPAWTPVLESFDPADVAPDLGYEREDRKTDALAAQRPEDWDYDRYVALVRQGRRLGWDEARLRAACPFRVEDPLTNAVFVRACEALAALHASAGDDRADRWRRQAERSRQAIRERLWDGDRGTFVAYDRVGDRPLRAGAGSIAGLLPVYAGVPTDDQFERLRGTLADFFEYEYACPSYVGPEMDPDRYWRGPVWLNTNWLLAAGLRRYGADDLADRLRRDSLALVDREGFREYFAPTTGEGRGSDRFSWTAALYLAFHERA